MNKRMLDKAVIPTEDIIESYLGTEAFGLLTQFEKWFDKSYDLVRLLRFPYGNNYGWSYKYSHKKSHLCDFFFEDGSFTVLVQIGDKVAPKINILMPTLLPKSQKLWNDREICGNDGGWIFYPVQNAAELADVMEMIKAKRLPIKH